jgi:TonB-dependent SusC/RagA subfamily outer membrane receptor
MNTLKSAIKYASVLIILLFSFTINQDSEDPFVASLRKQISNYFRNKPWEKLYLHIDRPIYKPGDDIWFKVYLTDGTTNRPTNIDDIVYVELINPKGSVEKKLVLQVISGICFGNFALNENAAGGLYKVKAYTNWMINFGNDYAFEKEIQVQKVVYPRLLSKLNFKRENYAPGDTVIADLQLENLDNSPLMFKDITIDIFFDGNKKETFAITSDSKGKAIIQCILPASLNTNDGMINAKIKYEGNIEAISRSIPIILNKINLQFFPESGYSIENVLGNIAFKALDEFGKPVDVEGIIADENDNIVTSFKSFHQGMGAFKLTPGAGKSYYAKITKPKIETKYKLSEAFVKGYSLMVERMLNDRYKVFIHSPVNGKVHIIIQAGKEICFSRSIDASIGKNYLEFSSNSFPVGTAIITLFDGSGIPRCERLAFFNYQKKMNISMTFDKKKYEPREKVTLKIRTLDGDSIPTSANLSLAVINDQLHSFADDKQHNITSWMLLGAEVKGKIEKPSFYFDSKEEKAEEALDYLLLTQGWRRYSWDDLIKMNCNITYQPEKLGSVCGVILNKKDNQPVKAEVTLIELNNKKRILKVNTGTNGQFMFLNADASSPLQILAKSEEIAPHNLIIQLTQFNLLNPSDNNTISNQKNFEINEVQKKLKQNNKVIDFQQTTADIVLSENLNRLEEVMVISNREISSSACCMSVRENAIEKLSNSIDNALQGRVAGLDITSNSGSTGSSTFIKIRGASSISNGSNPLYIIDGVVFDPNISGYSSPLQNLHLDNIETISVLKDAASSSIYGSAAVNGIIVISTKHKNGYFKSIRKNPKPNYAGFLIAPRKLSVTKEFYYPDYEENKMPSERTDFRSTIYWNPNINTNNAGEASVEFYASDEITSFRAIAEGISSNGFIGRSENKMFTQLPFSMAVKIPTCLTFNDTVLMPLILKNNTDTIIKGKLKIQLPAIIEFIEDIPTEITINKNSSNTILIPLVVKTTIGKGNINIAFENDNYSDAFVQEILVQPKGFPKKLSVSNKSKETNFEFIIDNPLTGSLTTQFTAYPDVLSDLMSGIESIIHEPYGCFEQTSSSTYPNILALDYLNETGTVNEEIRSKALKYIDMGYKRLIGFETPQNGFEWFGKAPGHEGLTAYGLMEFTDMKRVYNKVDDKMLQRTSNWLLNRRDGKGGFKKLEYGYDGFASSTNDVLNAYIVYALSEAGINGIEKEYQKAFEEALKSMDPYRLGLMANAAANYKKDLDYLTLINHLERLAYQAKWDSIKIAPSITMSFGKSLSIETAGLSVMALLKSKNLNWSSINKSVNYLIKSRSYGGFGSTQATIIALKALKEYAIASKITAENGTIEVTINETNTTTYSYKKGDKGKIAIGALEKYLREGKNKVLIRYLETNSPLPFSFDATWNSLTHESNNQCKVKLNTELNTSKIKQGETVRLHVKIANASDNSIPMTIAKIGIPSGLSLQPWQLKEVKDKEKVDFFEIINNYLVLYYRKMNAGEVKNLVLDLKADISGTYQAPASSAYLYYTNEYKSWANGEIIRILP